MSKELLERGDLSGLPEQGLAVVGFSGGADSTALAHWLSRKIDRDRIVLAHVNHMLRGEEAERDEAAAREFARETGLRFVVFRADVRTLAKERGMGLEECGRAVRYEFFQSLAPGENDRILTAHNANDNAETLLLNLSRGAGLSGLCGIPPQRGKILRPLLGVSRREIEEYCEENGLSYVEDSTNADPGYARNKVRLEILPLLEELNPRAVEAMGQAAELLRRDWEFLRDEAEELLDRCRRPYGLDIAGLLEAPEALRSAALKLWLEDRGSGRLERKHLAIVEDCLRQGGAAQLPGPLQIRAAGGLLSAGTPQADEPFCLPVAAGETLLPGGKALVLEELEGPFSEQSQKIHNLDFKYTLDCDIMKGTLMARTRREGDRFSPVGREGGKSLKQVFRECGMPADLRGSAVLLECGGQVVFCEGAGTAREFRGTPQSRKVLLVRVKTGKDKGDTI